jgi:hypothetical protein
MSHQYQLGLYFGCCRHHHTIAATATTAVVDCYVFLTPPLDFVEPVIGCVAHDPIITQAVEAMTGSAHGGDVCDMNEEISEMGRICYISAFVGVTKGGAHKKTYINSVITYY